MKQMAERTQQILANYVHISFNFFRLLRVQVFFISFEFSLLDFQPSLSQCKRNKLTSLLRYKEIKNTNITLYDTKF